MDKRKKLLLLLALILACTSAFAQQTAFTFDAQVWPNAVIGGYVFDSNTRIDAIALADSGAVAFTAHRENGGTGRDQTAVFTKERLVAREGQVTDGKEILRIAPAVLGVTNLGQVAYEVLYRQPGHKDVHGGIFVEGHFATEFEPSPTGAPTQFTVADDGMIRLRDGILTPKSGTPVLNGRQESAIERFKNVFLQRAMRNNPYGDIIGASADGVDITIWDRVNRVPTQKRSQVAQASDAKSSCPPPAFPYPATWTLGATNSGPIAAHLFEEGSPSKSYDSPVYGRISGPFRQIQFDKSCAPMVIAIGDKNGHLEVRAPSGILTFAKPDGTLQLPGYFQNAVAGSFITSDVSFAINARGQIAIRIVVDGGGAVLLATPVIVKP